MFRAAQGPSSDWAYKKLTPSSLDGDSSMCNLSDEINFFARSISFT